MKSFDKVWFSAKELEELDLPDLPKQATNITRKALKELWIKRDAVGVKGGGNEYHITSLPRKAQEALGFKSGINAIKDSIVREITPEEQNKGSELSGTVLNNIISMIDSFASIKVSAGFGSFNEGVTKPDGQEPYADSLLHTLGVNAKKCAVFWASGDSMYPTIDNGDQLLVDLSRNEIRGDNNIYIVQNGDSVWVKRVKLLWDGVELISDNREEYELIKITADQAQNLQIIGQVVHIGHSLV
ncbi:TPA: helix-turn-helix transcriptional regulator [Mannheimia haemolytica]|uniref:Helix-turn-helix transcriptional regulator n=1 Tax=Mannheimia haemolytica TaxID=75985 RepID=A0A547EFA4_MANHA|nr:helix-turn-helix transcriptional regulator [Mannheimia haemolytica]YP_009196050.1 helix-turn-helix transcriptional regulator [Mannheimia phage vB_MhM_3927AP2]AWW71148.1 helix-turn-helix transcriptional regulator [Pasteurellaceae bacterium 12565]AGK02876.1 putative HTH-type transcriptional regulator [Mannheimia haemolytica M42548]AGQ41568.1 transcriptional regulator [Mannheimia haemolytica D174]AGR75436.1 transcriptional regulator [Mannheimia haemolytica USMARC_2286]AJA73157.1 transcription